MKIIRSEIIAMVTIDVFDPPTGKEHPAVHAAELVQEESGSGFVIILCKTARGVSIKRSFAVLLELSEKLTLQLSAVITDAGVVIEEGVRIKFRCDWTFDDVMTACRELVVSAATKLRAA